MRPRVPVVLRRRIAAIVACLFVMVVVAGCASPDVTSRGHMVTEQLSWPVNIWIYDFAATPADVPAESWFAGKSVDHDRPQTAEQIAAGRQLGSEISTELVKEIRRMRMPATRTWPSMGIIPQTSDIVIRGYILFEQEGAAPRRFAIGLGAGASELRTAVECFQMTAHGLRRLGSGTADSEGGKEPGATVGVAGLLATRNPAGFIISRGVRVYDEETGTSDVGGWSKHIAVEIADVFKERFQEQGWIK